ncbi:MAG: threonine/serine dehydratase [Tahibacter sp.]
MSGADKFMPDRSDIDAAARRIAGHVRETPTLRPGAHAFGIDAQLSLKLEGLQHTGSFKPRGAFNRVLARPPLPAAGLIAASGGNHGAAVAYVAQQLGARAEIFVPEIVVPSKLARLRAYGATVQIGGRAYADALQACELRAQQSGALAVHAYDDPHVVAGAGTLAREFEAQSGALDTVLVAVGGGGLIAGVAAWYAGHTRVIAVEPSRSCALHAALAAGQPCDVDVAGIAADSLGARRVGRVPFAIAQRFVAQCVLVDDDAIRSAQRALWDELRVFAEPGGATAFAALLSGAYAPAPGERVGVIVCGANGDPSGL